MKKFIKFIVLSVTIIFLLISCDSFPHIIKFENKSSYLVYVKCDVTNPSSFTLEPGDDVWIDSKVNSAADLNIEYNDNIFVRMSVNNLGNVVFTNK